MAASMEYTPVPGMACGALLFSVYIRFSVPMKQKAAIGRVKSSKRRASRKSRTTLAPTLCFASILVTLAVIFRSKREYNGPNITMEGLYEPLHESSYFHECRAKIAKCNQTRNLGNWVCLDHAPSAHHPDRMSRDHPPRLFSWSRTCDPESCGLVFIGAENANESKYWGGDYCRILFGLESPDLFPTKAVMEQFIDKADIILTYSHKVEFSRPDKVFPFFGASTWIQPEGVRIHDKHKLVSIIASKKNYLKGHKLRHLLIHEYHNRFDVFGLGYRPVEHKETALAPYMYSVVIENSQDYLFFSEKIIDTFLTGAIPIYWGGSKVPELFNKRGIKLFNGHEDFAMVLDGCTEEYYTDNLDAIRENFRIALQFSSPELALEDHVLKQLGFTP